MGGGVREGHALGVEVYPPEEQGRGGGGGEEEGKVLERGGISQSQKLTTRIEPPENRQIQEG